MKQLFFMILFACFCAGCAGNQNWSHANRTQQEFHRDVARCEAMSNSAGNPQMMYGGSSFANGWNQAAAAGVSGSKQRIFQNCMLGEGYFLTGNNN